MPFPVVTLQGTPTEQGRSHGEALRTEIGHNLTLYFDRFTREAMLPREEVLRRATRYGAAIQRLSPDYHAAMVGVAEGAGQPLDEIVALNVRYEILYYQFGKIAMSGSDGCTTFAVRPEGTTSGHLLIGQNWDWIPGVRGAVLDVTGADGFRHLCFTEAGIVGGKIGLNEAGLGLTISGMTTTGDDWNRLSRPFHVRTDLILRSRRLEEAAAVITGEARACAANFLIAQVPDQVLDIEAAPEATHVIACDGPLLTHANHFVDAAGMGITEPPNERRWLSVYRARRMRALLQREPVSAASLRTILADHDRPPRALCRHEDPDQPPEQRTVTVTGVIMDLTTRTMTLSDGNPCEGRFQEVALAV